MMYVFDNLWWALAITAVIVTYLLLDNLSRKYLEDAPFIGVILLLVMRHTTIAEIKSQVILNYHYRDMGGYTTYLSHADWYNKWVADEFVKRVNTDDFRRAFGTLASLCEMGNMLVASGHVATWIPVKRAGSMGKLLAGLTPVTSCTFDDRGKFIVDELCSICDTVAKRYQFHEKQDINLNMLLHTIITQLSPIILTHRSYAGRHQPS